MRLRSLPSDAVNKASCYLTGEGHPSFEDFNRGCSACSLKSGEAVGFAAPDDLSKVRLIVVSDYPGAYEVEFNWPQVPNISVVLPSRRNKPKVLPFRNSGQLLREIISDRLNLCPWGEVFYTNAVKCDPNYKGRSLTVVTKHLKTCSNLWLQKELKLLDEKCPNVPIIVAGSKALDCIGMCYPEVTYESKKWNLKALRGRKDLRLNDRPMAVTFNPALIARNEMRIETDVRIDRRKGQKVISEVVWWHPPMIGTPLWHFIKDINWLIQHF